MTATFRGLWPLLLESKDWQYIGVNIHINMYIYLYVYMYFMRVYSIFMYLKLYESFCYPWQPRLEFFWSLLEACGGQSIKALPGMTMTSDVAANVMLYHFASAMPAVLLYLLVVLAQCYPQVFCRCS